MKTHFSGVHGPVDLSDRRRRMYDFLHEHPVGVVSTTDPDGNPHGAVIYFTVDKNFIIRFMTKKQTRKYDNLIHNNRMMLTVFEPLTQSTIQFEGTAIEREGQNATNEVATSLFDTPLATSDSGLPPLAKLQAGAFTTFRVIPILIRMAIYARPETGDYNELFESIESFELNDG